MSELMRCPACDYAPWVGPAPESAEFELVACCNMGCPLHEVYMTPEHWNTRPIESRLERERDEARAEIACLHSFIKSTGYDMEHVRTWQQYCDFPSYTANREAQR